MAKASAKGSGPKGKKSAAKGGKGSGARRFKSSDAPRSKRAASSREQSASEQTSSRADNAADALIRLVESPLVADLLAAAVTAAAATMLEHKLKRKQDSGSLVRAVGAAAAAAVGRQLASELAEISKAAQEARSGKEE